MTPPLFLLEQLPLEDAVLLTGDEGRHAAQVMRLQAGEPVLLSDGLGALLRCTVTESRPDGLMLRVEERALIERPRPALVVVQALPKGERGELACEVMTELEVDRIVPWQAARSISQWRGPRADRGVAKWQRTAREAAKQSRRPHVPVVSPLADTAIVCGLLARHAGLVLHEGAETPLVDVVLPTSDELVLVVGPEGGIADDELAAFATAGATAVRLGESVLRTSTAGAAALAALAVRLGRWGNAR